jgi:CubicO group peptidase (beta-lactamase class C family)
MDSLRLKRSFLWLVLVAFAAGCTCTTPIPESASTLVPTSTLAVMPDATPALATPVPPTAYWPTEGWRICTPEEQGMDSALLEQMLDAISDRQLNVHGVVVVRNGYIVAETYFPPYDQDTRHEIYSCTKSFISALIGIAIGEGYIEGIDQPVLSLFPDRTFANLDPRKEAMTLEHLLTMTSGLDWEEGMPIYVEMVRSGDWVRFVLDKPMVAEPGSEFNYCSGCSHLMSAIIQETAGMNTLDFAQSRLFEPLGITNVHWESDPAGIPNGGWGLHITPRDMAKLGYLCLNDGIWDGRQIVPAEWVRASVQDKIETEVEYGYQWWVLPALDAYAARGLNGQAIFVIPDLDIVAVFTGEIIDATSDVLLELVEEFVVPAVQ